MTSSTHDTTVQAAGCVLWRHRPAGGLELALVHRPKWDDWSWPKGKLKRGETFEDAARREVLEETGYTCRLGTRLPSAHYVDHHGRPKEVRYWAAEATGGAFAPNDEVDVVHWVTPDEAHERLSYDRDRDLISLALMAVGTDEDPPG